jgi:hypothetical protein
MTVLALSPDADSLTVELSGALDDEVGRQLLEVTRVALVLIPEVIIDLAAVSRWTFEGMNAVVECAELGATVPAGENPAGPDR